MIPFHRVLITTGIMFCLGFATWALARFIVVRQPGALALSAVFVALAAALTYYLINLKRFLRR